MEGSKGTISKSKIKAHSQHRGDCILLCGSVAVGQGDVLHKIDDILTKENEMNILKQYPKTGG